MERFFGYARQLADPGTAITTPTITIYDVGTLNLATIYDDDLSPPTAKANPFVGDSDGFFFFYAPNGRYDVNISGGTPAIPAPYTWGDVSLGLGDSGVPSYAKASLPTSDSAHQGRLARVSDDIRGLWMDSGSQWTPIVPVVNVAEFDGVDAAAKINAALTSLPARGGIADARGLTGEQTCATNPFAGITNKSFWLLLGATTFLCEDTWVIPGKCVVSGMGRGEPTTDPGTNNTVIRASKTFTSTYMNNDGDARRAMVVLGDSPNAPPGVQVRDLAISCDAVADIGLYSEAANELGGWDRITVYNAKNYGIWLENLTPGVAPGTPQNYYGFEAEVSFQIATIPATAVGVWIDAQAGDSRGINGLTVNGQGANSGNGIATGLLIDGGAMECSRLHFEGVTDGVLIGATRNTTGTSVIGASGHSTVTNLVRVSNSFTSQSIFLCALTSLGSTNVLNDEISGHVLTASDLGFYSLGQGTPGSNVIITDSRVTRQQFRTDRLEISFASGNDGILRFREGETQQWNLQNTAANAGFQIFDVVNSLVRLSITTGSQLDLASDGATPVRVNAITDSGTGGLEIFDGGATPVRLVAIDASGDILPETTLTQKLGSSVAQWQVFHEVVATASLPPALGSNDGRVIIEDGGAGNRNLIIYGGGQRFRINGGAAF